MMQGLSVQEALNSWIPGEMDSDGPFILSLGACGGP